MNNRYPPVSRRNDLISSHEAENEINQNNNRAVQQEILLKIVKDTPGLTSREMTLHCNLDRYQIARRLSDLKNGNLIYQGDIRICSIGNRKATTWCPIVPIDS